MQSASDDEIFKLAADQGRTIVSADTDFGMLLALSGASKPSVIIFRRGADRRFDAQLRILKANLTPVLVEALERGAAVVFEQTRVRIRMLPIGGPSIPGDEG